MKTIAAQTPNGNLIYQLNNENLIFIKEKNRTTNFNNYHGISSFDEILKALPNKEIDTEKLISDEEMLEILKKENQILKDQIEGLNKIKSFYGECPKWHLEGFKNQQSYSKHLLKLKMQKFYANAKKNFKLRSNKAVDSELCFIFTTEYTGKNNGFRHFNRSINQSLNRIVDIQDYSRNKNLCVKSILGNVIEVRGNVESNECIIRF